MLGLCIAWISASCWAALARDAWLVPNPRAAIVIGVALAAGAVVASRAASGGLVAAVLYAVVGSALVVTGGLESWDAAAAFFILLATRTQLRDRSPWLQVALVGVACGCSVLAAPALVALAFGRNRALAILVRMCAAGMIGLVGVVIAFVVFGRPWSDALWLSPDIAFVGTQHVWWAVGEWGDWVLPVVALSLPVAASRFFEDDASGDASRSSSRHTTVALVWFALNLGLAATLPRCIVHHGLLFVLPAFVLAPGGWRMLRELPVHRSSWALSVFSIACYILMAMLVWPPLRVAAEAILVALFPA